MTDITGPKISFGDHATRKRRRLERELRALRVMRQHLRTRDIICAVLAIPALALLCLSVAFKLHWVSGSGLLAFTGALAFGALIWWIGRRWFLLAIYIVFALVLIRFGAFYLFDAPYLGPTNRKPKRQIKLEQAIAKREAMLRELNGTRS
jgi:hypothetical protein